MASNPSGRQQSAVNNVLLTLISAKNVLTDVQHRYLDSLIQPNLAKLVGRGKRVHEEVAALKDLYCDLLAQKQKLSTWEGRTRRGTQRPPPPVDTGDA